MQQGKLKFRSTCQASYIVPSKFNHLTLTRWILGNKAVMSNTYLWNTFYLLLTSILLVLNSMPIEFIDVKSTMVWVMIWCCQTISHYLIQCWPSSKTSYCIRGWWEKNGLKKKILAILVLRQIWVNIGSGNGLLPDGTKPLPEPMLTYHQ